MKNTDLKNGLPVHGYQPQTEENVAMVNRNKEFEEILLRQVDAMMKGAGPPPSGMGYDGRWIAIARTHFEQGFMALNRAVFKPGRVKLPEDE